jgi:DNA-binding SARP family transcriptional activator
VSQIRLRILGESVIQVGETIVEPSATHLFALLLYLAIERGKLIPRGQLASMLFPEVNATNAGHNLRQLLYRLRRIGVPLETTAAAVRLPAESVVEAPECLLARSHGEAVLVGPISYALLPTYCPPTSPLSRWLETYRDEISAKLLRRIARDLARAREGADWTAVERCARALLDLDPLNETATLGLAETMARSGSKHKAVKLLHDFADDVGRSHSSLALPPRLLTRRISEEAQSPTSNSVRTPLVGRTDELRTLTEAWSHARRGHYTIAAVTGEKSIGKSRVLEELSELVRMDGSGVVLAARTQSTDCQRPLSLFSDMCAALLLLPGAAGCSPESLPHLRRLQGAPALASGADRAGIDAFPPEGATRRAIIDLVDSVSSERPLLICVDDADQLDDSSRELLASLPDISPSLPVLVVVAGNRISRLPQRRHKTTRLGPLTRDNARALARLMWDRVSHSSSLETLEWCIDAAAGNPGHLDLLVRHTAALRDTPAAPPGLLALLDSRLESLSGADKHVLQACVVFGAECCAETVDALTGIGGYDLLVSLEGLVEAGLVIDSESGISCRSSLLAERIRNSTTPVVRRLLHRRAAEYLERLSDAKWMSQATAWRIADHWQAAGNRAKSLQWRRECWHQSLSIGQPMAAADSIRTYLPNSSSDREKAALLDDLIHALQHGSDVAGQLSTLRDRVVLSDRVGDTTATRLRLAADIAEARFLNYEDTTQFLPELQALLASNELDEMRRLRAARVLMITADTLVDRSLALAVSDAMPQHPRSQTASLLRDQVELIFHSVFGDRDVAVRIAESIALLADKQELSPASVSAQLTAALALRIVDTKPSDTSKLERLFDRCLASSMYNAAIRTSARIGSFLCEDGALDSARYWSQRASELIDQTGIQRVCSDYLTLRIDLALECGDLASAQRLVDSAPHHCPIYATPRLSKEYLVYRLRVAQHHADRAVSPQDIECLMEWHRRAKHLGRHDDNMEVLWTALWREGKRAEASWLLRDYLFNARRERRTISFMLHSRTHEDPVWSELVRVDATLGTELERATNHAVAAPLSTVSTVSPGAPHGTPLLSEMGGSKP